MEKPRKLLHYWIQLLLSSPDQTWLIVLCWSSLQSVSKVDKKVPAIECSLQSKILEKEVSFHQSEQQDIDCQSILKSLSCFTVKELFVQYSEFRQIKENEGIRSRWKLDAKLLQGMISLKQRSKLLFELLLLQFYVLLVLQNFNVIKFDL